MADEVMEKHGLHFDELNKIRVLHPDVASETGELKEECKEFVGNIFGRSTIHYHLSLNSQTQVWNSAQQEEVFLNTAEILYMMKLANTHNIGEFQKIVGTFIDMVDKVAHEVEKEKMKAIGSRNLLKSIAKQREAQQQQLHALIAEKRMQLERLRVQYEALQKEEQEQNEFIEQFILQK